jgi:hypothetical protein
MPDELDKALPRWCTELLEMLERAKQEHEGKVYKTQHHPYAQGK